VEETTSQTTPQKSSLLREFAEALLPALVIVLVINTFVAQATRVDGHSMTPNLLDGERLIIEKMSYRFDPPQRGDIIVIDPPSHTGPPLIKRVIGLPGEGTSSSTASHSTSPISPNPPAAPMLRALSPKATCS